MFSGFISAFRTPDLRKKLLLTLGIIAIYRLGVAIPTPGVSYENVQFCASSTKGNSACTPGVESGLSGGSS